MLKIEHLMNRNTATKDLKIVYLEVDVSLKKQEKRPPVDMYVLLDVSKSMEGNGKLEQAKSAIMHIFDVMEPYDRLNVISFSRQANLLGENMNSLDRDGFYDAVMRNLKASGNTMLSRALTMTLSVMKEKSKETKSIKKVVLISDGKPTEKNNTLKDFIYYVYSRFSPFASFLCIGIGADYNEELLRGMSEVTGGSWMHISGDEDVAHKVENEIKDLMNDSLYPVKMNFLPSKGVSIEEVYTQKPYISNLDYFKKKKSAWGYNFILPSTGGEREISCLFKLKVDSEMEGPMRLAGLTVFDYENKEYKDSISIEIVKNDSGEDNPRVRESFTIAEMMYSASKNLDNKEKMDEIKKKTMIILEKKPEIREEHGEELGKIMTAVQMAETGEMDSEEKKKTKIILTKQTSEQHDTM